MLYSYSKANRIIYWPKANNIDMKTHKIGDLRFCIPDCGEDEVANRLNRNFSADEASIWVKL